MEEQTPKQTTEQPAAPAPPAPADHTAAPAENESKNIGSLSRVMGVDLELRVELARVHMPIRDILELASGSVINLKKTAGEPVNLLVNDKLFAKGEAVIVDDQLGIRITEIASETPPREDLS